MDSVKPLFLDKSFDYYNMTGMQDPVRDPWILPKQEITPTVVVFPLPEPGLRPLAKVVPVPSMAPRQEIRQVLRQLKAPESVENPEPEEGAGEDTTEENGG